MIKSSYAKRMPSSIGVYVWKQNNTVLYIGKSINIRSRIYSHIERSQYDNKEAVLVKQSKSIKYILCNSDFQALLLESALIQKYKPKFNIVWRDDKGYLYIKIPMYEEFPRIAVVRKEDDGRSLYFGPFSSNRDARYLIRTSRQIIPFCMQKESITTPCFYSKIHLCNPCPATIRKQPSSSIYKETQRIYRRNIRLLTSLLQGKTEVLQKVLQKKIEDFSKREQFEEAITMRNKLQKLEYLLQNASFERFEHTHNHAFTQESLDNLVELISSVYPNKQSLHRIECFDVSNIQQQQATASLVVAVDGVIDKSQYRRFKLHSKIQGDIHLLSEAVQRRLRAEWPLPDLLIVDGGKPQMQLVKKILNSSLHSSIICVGIAKQPDRLVFFLNGTVKTVRPTMYKKGFQLIRQLRDEAHRFAKKYHRFIRSKELFQ